MKYLTILALMFFALCNSAFSQTTITKFSICYNTETKSLIVKPKCKIGRNEIKLDGNSLNSQVITPQAAPVSGFANYVTTQNNVNILADSATNLSQQCSSGQKALSGFCEYSGPYISIMTLGNLTGSNDAYNCKFINISGSDLLVANISVHAVCADAEENE